MTKSTRACCALDLKQEAVRLDESDQSIAAIARSLGLIGQTLYNWVRAQRQGERKGAGGKLVTAGQKEISRLRFKLARARMESDILVKSMASFCQTAEVMYASIRRKRRLWPIRVQRQVLGVSVAVHHEHMARLLKIARRCHLSDEAPLVHNRALFTAHRGADGWPRIWRQVRADCAPWVSCGRSS